MITRRTFLAGAALAALSAWTGNIFANTGRERSLNLANTHTGERLAVTYWSAGGYDRSAIDQINHLLRCHYTNDVKPIDIAVIDLLWGVADTIGREKEILIISGYRSPEYNAHLVKTSSGVAGHSLHLEGRAIDFRIPGIDNSRVARLAKSFSAGGVGRYAEFVHIDNGRVRSW